VTGRVSDCHVSAEAAELVCSAECTDDDDDDDDDAASFAELQSVLTCAWRVVVPGRLLLLLLLAVALTTREARLMRHTLRPVYPPVRALPQSTRAIVTELILSG